ncbi:MAG TPA: polymer-forming cytoskeletal protein [Bacteroidales bacterium]|nr:polymer-forming cytoskeletal protein [Bacteroidales bacterium]
MAEKNASPQSHAHEITRIPVGTEVRAAYLFSEKDVRIDGTFTGDIITSEKLIIGETGYLTAISVVKMQISMVVLTVT